MKINLGCGNNLLEGYINIDSNLGNFDAKNYQYWLVNALHIDQWFLSNSVEEVISSHFFEHLTHTEITELLFKIHGILKPKGKITTVVPNFHKLINRVIEDTGSGHYENIELFNFKIFSTENETVHKSIWSESIGVWYLTREDLYEEVMVEHPSKFEIKFTAIKK
jgi:predicted SAM-dependent methyltransferase